MIENEVNKNIRPLFIQEEMKSSFLDYAMSVIVSRALPDFRDGLKPVHRRILYAMYDLNNTHARAYVKSARVVGEVIGKYHPHGDSAVYNSLVRMAQDFSMRCPLVDGQGNFGSIDGDNAAAMRYTEVRMRELTQELLADIDKETVNFGPNYDDSLKEPLVLPTRIPNLLVNGSTGIAVGMATNIPPHNLKEILEALLLLIDNPSIPILDLLNTVKGPDFPTSGLILGEKGIKQAYLTGKGIIQLRAVSEIELSEKSNKSSIIVTELPYQVLKSKLIERIASLVHEKVITGISDIRDESSHLGIRVVIELKRNENPHLILNQLFKHSPMQVSYGINFLGLIQGRPKVMNLKEMLETFLAHRREVVVKRTEYDLRKAKEKEHLLEGLKIAVDHLDEVIQMIKTSPNVQEARERLIHRFELSLKQTQAILDMRLQKLTGLEKEKIVQEYQEIKTLVERLMAILSSAEEIDAIIKGEFIHLSEKYGDARRTQIEPIDDEIEEEALIKNEDVIITVTSKGYIKRMSLDTYKAQHRGGKGLKGADTSDDDYYTKILTANSHSNLLFFTRQGQVYKLKVYQVPEGSRIAKGRNIVNLIQLQQGDEVKEMLAVKDLSSDSTDSLLMATKRGVIKRSLFTEYLNIKQSGIWAIKLMEGDEVVSVRSVEDSDDALLCASSGKVIRFSVKDCRAQGRVSQGVKGINLEQKEHLVAMEVISLQGPFELLSITERGMGKRTPVDEYRKQSRGGKGIFGMKLTAKTGEIIQLLPVNEKADLVIITNKGQVIRIRINDISVQGRTTQGVRLINLNENEQVVAVEQIVQAEAEAEEMGTKTEQGED